MKQKTASGNVKGTIEEVKMLDEALVQEAMGTGIDETLRTRVMKVVQERCKPC